MGWLEVSRPGVTVAHSPRESAMFGFATARLTVGAGTEPTELQNVVDSLSIALQRNKLVIARWASECSWVAGLLSTSGFRLIPNTTLVYWSCDLTAQSIGKPQRNSYSATATEVHFEQATSLTQIVEIATESFENYPNHYSSNKYLPPKTNIKAYVEWLGSLWGQQDHNFTLGVDASGEVFGFGVLSKLNPGTAEFLLAAIRLSYRRLGLYDEINLEMLSQARAWGCQQLVSSTQANNYSGQKAWIRSGLKPVLAIDGCHLISETISE